MESYIKFDYAIQPLLAACFFFFFFLLEWASSNMDIKINISQL